MSEKNPKPAEKQADKQMPKADGKGDAKEKPKAKAKKEAKAESKKEAEAKEKAESKPSPEAMDAPAGDAPKEKKKHHPKKEAPVQKKEKLHHGQLEVDVIEGVQVDAKGRTITVKGDKGELTRKFREDFISFKPHDGKVRITAKSKRLPLRKQMAIMGTIAGHVKNMMKGVTKGFTYRLRIVYSHFPMKVTVKDTEFMVDNFLGEKYPRRTRILPGVQVEIKGNEVTASGIDKEDVGQTAANIEQLTRIKNLDNRIFQDGIYIIEKDGKPVM